METTTLKTNQVSQTELLQSYYMCFKTVLHTQKKFWKPWIKTKLTDFVLITLLKAFHMPMCIGPSCKSVALNYNYLSAEFFFLIEMWRAQFGKWLAFCWNILLVVIFVLLICLAKSSCVCAKLLQLCPTLCDPMDHSLPGSSAHGIHQQEYWSGGPCPPPGDLPDPGIEPMSLTSPTFGWWVLYC